MATSLLMNTPDGVSDTLLLVETIWGFEYGLKPGSIPQRIHVLGDNIDNRAVREAFDKLDVDAATWSLIGRVMQICEDSDSDALNAVAEAISAVLDEHSAAEQLANAVNQSAETTPVHVPIPSGESVEPVIPPGEPVIPPGEPVDPDA